MNHTMNQAMTRATVSYEPVDPAITANPIGVYETTSRLLETMRQSDVLERHDLDMVSKILAYAADAEQKIKVQKSCIQQLETMAITDELTGLRNHRGFDKALERTLANAKRHSEQGLLVQIELPGLEKINRTFGYRAGEAVIKAIGTQLADCSRDTDYVARIATGKFAIILTHAEQDGARARIIALKVLLNSVSVRFGTHLIRVRVSASAKAYDGTSSASELMHSEDDDAYHNMATMK